MQIFSWKSKRYVLFRNPEERERDEREGEREARRREEGEGKMGDDESLVRGALIAYFHNTQTAQKAAQEAELKARMAIPGMVKPLDQPDMAMDD